jgi:hypothetical protein
MAISAANPSSDRRTAPEKARNALFAVGGTWINQRAIKALLNGKNVSV